MCFLPTMAGPFGSGRRCIPETLQPPPPRHPPSFLKHITAQVGEHRSVPSLCSSACKKARDGALTITKCPLQAAICQACLTIYLSLLGQISGELGFEKGSDFISWDECPPSGVFGVAEPLSLWRHNNRPDGRCETQRLPPSQTERGSVFASGCQCPVPRLRELISLSF